MNASPTREPSAPIASARHTMILVAILAGIAVLMWSQAHATGATAPSRNRAGMYVGLIVSEWVLAFYCWNGIRRTGVSAKEIVGRFGSLVPLLARAAVTWAVVFVVAPRVIAMAGARDTEAARRTLAFVAPHGPVEITLWIVLALSAGLCEEFVFRGYLQRQLAALTRREWLGIALAALLFGIGHAYQGWLQVVAISVFGLLLGMAARAFQSLLPGMVAHAFEDLIGGLSGH